ncbi:hypothetical protein Pcinc_039703 [Petrolisthes cinctipes]|uniref:Ionotropic glutamate receptor C-terminal domain-containing protein n=1 Tax=Petrolisthes cinctipes TaxID=88211 RepID=A0AAE1EIV5_PETCI|nr:hypothetical protein Pcinc_039703 [Petrolisthes cinctipes]
MLASTTIFVSSVLTFLLHRLQHVRDPINFILKVSGSLVLQAMKDREVRGVWWGRVWLVVWWVAVVILSAAYTGNLVAVLTVPVFPKFIYTVQDLALADVRMLMLDYGSSIPSYLRTSNNPTLAALGTKLDINPITNPTDLYKQSIVDVMTGRHALIVFGDYIDYLRAKHGVMAYTYVVKERIFGAALSWFLPRHTPYTTTISDALMQLTETGVMDKLYQMHRSNVITPNTQIRGDGVINLGHMQGAFILLGLGAVVAFFTLIQELII